MHYITAIWDLPVFKTVTSHRILAWNYFAILSVLWLALQRIQPKNGALHQSLIKITPQSTSTALDMWRRLKGGFTLFCYILRVIPSKLSTDMHIQKASILNSINIQVKLIEIDNILSIITLITQSLYKHVNKCLCFEKWTQTHSAVKSYLHKCNNFCPLVLHLSHTRYLRQ